MIHINFVVLGRRPNLDYPHFTYGIIGIFKTFDVLDLWGY